MSQVSQAIEPTVGPTLVQFSHRPHVAERRSYGQTLRVNYTETS